MAGPGDGGPVRLTRVSQTGQRRRQGCGLMRLFQVIEYSAHWLRCQVLFEAVEHLGGAFTPQLRRAGPVEAV